MISRHKKTIERTTRPAKTTITITTTQKEEEATESMRYTLATAEEGKGCYRTLLDTLIITDVPGYRNFTRMKPAFYDLIEERLNPNQEVRNKL